MKEDEHLRWCVSTYAMLNDGGIWSIPRSGLIFKKDEKRKRFHLVAWMPHDPFMKITPEELKQMQDEEFEAVREHMAEVGVEVTR